MVNNVVLGLMLVYGLIGLSMWVIGLVAGDRRGFTRSVPNVVLYVTFGLFLACVCWPFAGLLPLKQDLEEIFGRRG